MSDINRRPDAQSVHNVHLHHCPSCGRAYNCNCHTQPDRDKLTCIDCEHGNYDPIIYGGHGTRSEA